MCKYLFQNTLSTEVDFFLNSVLQLFFHSHLNYTFFFPLRQQILSSLALYPTTTQSPEHKQRHIWKLPQRDLYPRSADPAICYFLLPLLSRSQLM